VQGTTSSDIKIILKKFSKYCEKPLDFGRKIYILSPEKAAWGLYIFLTVFKPQNARRNTEKKGNGGNTA
jgi:hypothetical protein